MTRQQDPTRLTTPDSWRLFQEIMHAIQFDGGTLTGVNAVMDVAERIGQQITRMADHLHNEQSYIRNLLAAVPAREEAEAIWRMRVGPGGQLPDPDPAWIAVYIRTRLTEEAPDAISL